MPAAAARRQFACALQLCSGPTPIAPPPPTTFDVIIISTFSASKISRPLLETSAPLQSQQPTWRPTRSKDAQAANLPPALFSVHKGADGEV